VVDCKVNSFLCLLINLNSTEQRLKRLPQTQELPKLSSQNKEAEKLELNKRSQASQAQLRLAHIKEEEIRQICTEFIDVFKLPGDKLSATSAIKHHFPTPSISVNRAITLRNYRIPEQHQSEVNTQVQQMLEVGIMQQSKSPWNFPIFVVPKKLDASGKRKWRMCRFSKTQ
jgi:hypothetical protein